MSDAIVAGGVLGVGALLLAAMIAAVLRSGEIVGRYGMTVTRAAAPRRFWAAVVTFMGLDAVLAVFAGLAFLYKGR